MYGDDDSDGMNDSYGFGGDFGSDYGSFDDGADHDDGFGSTDTLAAPETDTVAHTVDSVSEGYADIIREDYDDWKMRFQPFEGLQQDMLLDPTKRGEMRSNALGYVDQASDAAVGQTKANMHMNDRRFGQQLSADEKQSRERRLGNQAALSKADSRTQMRQDLNDREVSMLAGGL